MLNRKKGTYTVLSNRRIAENIYELMLDGYTGFITAPGQFVNVALPGFFLRRPISICDYDDYSITLVYKTVGRGTKVLATTTAGQKLDVLTGFGNGYHIKPGIQKPLLIGGGAGTPPLYGLAKALNRNRIKYTVLLGFNRAQDAFYYDKFQALGADVTLCTLDGSLGIKAQATELLKTEDLDYDYVYACGPEAMLRIIYDFSKTDGQYSFEEHMACGFGACMGCTCRTKGGSKRICKDGPVLYKDEILWDGDSLQRPEEEPAPGKEEAHA